MTTKNATQPFDPTIRRVLEDVREMTREGRDTSTDGPYEKWLLELGLTMSVAKLHAMGAMNQRRLSPAARYLLQVLILGGPMGTITLYAQGIGMIQKRDVEGYRYIFGDEPPQDDPDLSQHILLRFHAAARELLVKRCATIVEHNTGQGDVLRATPFGFLQGGDVSLYLMALITCGYLRANDDGIPDLTRPLKPTDAMVLKIMELLAEEPAA